ncbi:hypothetical protein BHE74_00021338 [Ensete ventricosum]|nr:hypothetical protein GW17_00025108 [Ensete ventricosum]RWW70956.1 hypothetical protein BHE74_00021338 [Ensete ventricosum]
MAAASPSPLASSSSQSPRANANHDLGGDSGDKSITLGQLFKRVGDAYNSDVTDYDGCTSPEHYILNLDDFTPEGSTGDHLASRPSLSSLPSTPSSKAIFGTKTLLNSISGEVREGEIFMVLGLSGSDTSTLNDTHVNRVMGDSLQDSINGEKLKR